MTIRFVKYICKKVKSLQLKSLSFTNSLQENVLTTTTTKKEISLVILL
jgi:hypothetical protein